LFVILHLSLIVNLKLDSIDLEELWYVERRKKNILQNKKDTSIIKESVNSIWKQKHEKTNTDNNIVIT